MIFVYLFVVAAVCGFVGMYMGSLLNQKTYHGLLIVEESEEGLKYLLEIAGDPEYLMFEDSVTLKVVPPDYEKALSRGKLGV